MNSSFRKFVLFVTLVALAWFSYVYMLKPANAEIAKQRSDIIAKQAKLSELEKLSSVANDAGRQLSRLAEAVQFFQDKLPLESEIHKVLESITLIAQKQGLDCGKITAMKTKNYNGYIEQPLEMELSGDFQAFYSFLIEVEKLQRIIRVRELELKKDTAKPGQLNADMIISVFFST
ncbi:MAG: type IV pilus inner membrane component PilO [Sedimentisphaerales bacterium]